MKNQPTNVKPDQPAESKACASVGVEPSAELVQVLAGIGYEAAQCSLIDRGPAWQEVSITDALVWMNAAEAIYTALASPAPSVVAEMPPLPKPTLWLDDKGIRGYSSKAGPGPWFSADDMHAYRLATPPAAPAATEAPSEPVARLFVSMERHDMGQSLAPPPPPFRFAQACALPASGGLPVGEYDLRLAIPAPAAPAVGASKQEIVDLLTSAAWQLKQHAENYNHVSSRELPGKLTAAASALAAVGASVQPSDWLLIDGAPKDGRTLLLGYFNSAGKWRTLRGQWMSADYIAQNWEEPDEGEPGWYETVVESDDTPNAWRTNPTHYQLLPKEPGASVQPVQASLSDEQIDAIVASVMNGCFREYDHDDVRVIVRAALVSSTPTTPPGAATPKDAS